VKGEIMWGYYYDPTYILVIIGLVLCLGASAMVKSTYNRYKEVYPARFMSGAEVAERILHSAGIQDVRVEQVAGELTDHYDPREKVLRLSQENYNTSSVAAIGVAAHEAGHAIQHNVGYFPLKFRNAILPVANLGSQLGVPLVLIGLIFSFGDTLINVGILLFAFAVLFQVVTLPVEFNASKRAVKMLDEQGILYGEELSGCKKVLSAAAMTYVAAAASSALQLLRLVILGGKRRRD
jgi:Zn-dependent membrane protease YugP